MSRPVVSALTERIYELLEPLHADDAAHEYGMLVLTSAAAAMMEVAYGWSMPEDGSDPWQHLVDTADAGGGKPNEYLAQMLGISPKTTDPGLALFIMQQGLAHMRGTVAYLEAVVDYFMGENSVGVTERSDQNLDPDPYGIVIRTIGPMPDNVLRLVEQWKPAGLIAHLIDEPGPTYFDIAGTGDTYDVFEGELTDYDSIQDWTP